MRFEGLYFGQIPEFQKWQKLKKVKKRDFCDFPSKKF